MRDHLTRALAAAALVCLGGCSSDAPGAGPDSAAPDAPSDEGGVGDAGDAGPETDATAPSGVCADYNPNRSLFFGDLHVHTALSLDASLQGTRLRPTDAYRFARGEAVGIQPHDEEGNPQRTVQIDRPLDFAAVTDHAEFLGTVNVCTTPGSAAYEHPDCVQYREKPQTAFIWLNAFSANPQDNAPYPALCGVDGVDCLEPGRAAWQEIIDAAAAAHDPSESCEFTAFVGYEWSGNPGTQNLHRNVIFRNEHVPALPTSYLEETYPEGLWKALRRDCLDADTGCDVMAIPHNSNLSDGLMYGEQTAPGETFDKAYAIEQAAMEPIHEIFQHKGSSECMPGTLASDELCNFEVLPYSTLAGANLDIEDDPEPIDFVREILGRGLELAQELGENPWAFGFIAATDTHIAAPGFVSEGDFAGHGGAGQGHADELPKGLPDSVAFNAGGLAAVWAEERSRDAIFDALRRREAYGTSGPRITLRLFAGWGYAEGLCDAVDFVEQGYAGGVPMGGVLPPKPEGAGAPRFAVSALADPGGDNTPLQRVQIVRGRLTSEGLQYDVFDAAGGPNDASVDTSTCETSGAGADALCAVFSEPDFDPEAPAFYYARVIENPTCRWTTRKCAAASVDCADEATVTEGFEGCCDDRFQQVVQERAWSSPVWYQP